LNHEPPVPKKPFLGTNAPRATAKYLNDALETGDPVFITKAIGAMVRAQGAAGVAQKAGELRESLYRMFGGKVSPAFDTAIAVLLALGLQLNVKPARNLKRTLAAIPSRVNKLKKTRKPLPPDESRLPSSHGRLSRASSPTQRKVVFCLGVGQSEYPL
jgi:probable addiction module antidote protein